MCPVGPWRIVENVLLNKVEGSLDFFLEVFNFIDDSDTVTPAMIVFGGLDQDGIHEGVLAFMVVCDFEDEVPIIPNLEVLHVIVEEDFFTVLIFMLNGGISC